MAGASSPPATLPSCPAKALIVVPNWLGDVVLCLPALHALRELWPAAHLTLLCQAPLADWLRAQPIVDEVRSYPPPGLGLRANVAFARGFGLEGYEVAVLFPNSFRSALLIWLARIPERIGYARDGRGLLLTQRPPRHHGGKRHHAEYYLDLARHCGWRGSWRPTAQLPPARVAEADRAWVEERLATARVGGGDLLVALAPGAAYGPAKRWLPDRFAAVARRLLERWPLRILLLGGLGDGAVIEQVGGQLGAAAVNFAGLTTVGQLAAALQRCALLVTNDSGTMHLAAAVGAPVVAIFGSTDPEWTGPLGDGHRVLGANVPCRPCFQRTCDIGYQCMESLTVEAVAAEAAELLTRHLAAHGAANPPRRAFQTVPLSLS